jgi:hypothetical protein
MNSPDPGSPTSTDTSGSPTPDDYQFPNRDQQQIAGATDARSLNNIPSSFPSTSSSSKRRLPVGSSSEGPQRRDPKSRRREDTFGSASGSRRVVIDGQAGHIVGRSPALGGNTFQSRGDYTSRRDKEELIDLSLVELLRQGQSPLHSSLFFFLNFLITSLVRLRRSIPGLWFEAIQLIAICISYNTPVSLIGGYLPTWPSILLICPRATCSPSRRSLGT